VVGFTDRGLQQRVQLNLSNFLREYQQRILVEQINGRRGRFLLDAEPYICPTCGLFVDT
jgi:hypothetical protein